MRRSLSILACMATVLSLNVPARATSFYGAPELLLAGGYSWPAYGYFTDHWSPGFDLSGGFRSAVNPMIMSGLDIGYAWHGLKEDSFPLAPNASGADVGIFRITSETDVFLGGGHQAEKPAKFFINAGLGYYYASVDGGNIAGLDPNYLDTGAFGLHGGGGLLIGNGRARIRVDAGYHHMFMSGEDIGFVPVRGGIQIKLGQGQ